MKVVLSRAALTLMCAAALAIPSFAQNPAGNHSQARNPFSRLQQALNLSDTQVSQLQGLMQSQRAAMQPLVADVRAKGQALRTASQGTDPAAIGSAFMALKSSAKALKDARTANRNAMMAVLTPAQQKIVTDYQTIAKAGGAGLFGGGNRFRGHGFGRWHGAQAAG